MFASFINNKLRFILLLVLFLISAEIFTTSDNALAACSIRTLKNLCTTCEERALEKLEIDSVCPSCPEVNCPTASLACIRTDSFNPLLKQRYTFVGTVEGSQDVIFKLNISKNDDYTGAFSYEVRYKNFQIVAKNNVGFLIYDVVNFNLPYEIDKQLYSFNCIGGIDTNSIFQGGCSTIYKDSAGIVQSYGFPFIATPNDSPIQ
ncbi:MAG: hypothetical protein HYR97_02990 [Candidatus Melainabacteria bacterium]|nr:hypothetical protein [Candidatus Melainabacteria bacterium]MBI3309580.1 hypothetical protein [Candidatus Melainabacteria bacterium]